MKSIIAEKCKDGWLVKIIDSRMIFTESDVYKLIKQQGLVPTKIYNTKQEIKSYGKKYNKEQEYVEEELTDEVIKIYAE